MQKSEMVTYALERGCTTDAQTTKDASSAFVGILHHRGVRSRELGPSRRHTHRPVMPQDGRQRRLGDTRVLI
jgi:hypothetical protein